AIFGNFINRVMVLTQKYYEGAVPQPGDFNAVDLQTLEQMRAYPAVIASSIERYRFREAQSELMNLARLGNKYLADEEPWKLIKTDPGRVQTQMFIALQIAAALGVLAEPFLPFTAKLLRNMLHLPEGLGWNDVSTVSALLSAGSTVNQPHLLFEKIEDEAIEAQIQKLEHTKSQNQSAINTQTS